MNTIFELLQSLRLSLLQYMIPVTQWFGDLHFPFTRKRVKGYHLYSLVRHLKPGGVFLAYKRGEISNILIPGHFKHAAMYVFEDEVDIQGHTFHVPYVVEAIGKGVVKTDLISFMTSKDDLIYLYPKFATSEQMGEAAKIAKEQIGKPYDYLFDPGSTSFYCAELIQFSYETVCGKGLFSKKKIMGVETVVPQDFADATDKWEVIWSSSGVKDSTI